METTDDLAASRTRERPTRRAPWTFRGQRPDGEVFVHVDALKESQGVERTEAHWDISVPLPIALGSPNFDQDTIL